VLRDDEPLLELPLALALLARDGRWRRDATDLMK
jgi:hypothetical protein